MDIIVKKPIKVMFTRKAFHKGKRYNRGEAVEFEHFDLAPKHKDGSLAHCVEIGAASNISVQSEVGTEVKVNSRSRRYQA